MDMHREECEQEWGRKQGGHRELFIMELAALGEAEEEGLTFKTGCGLRDCKNGGEKMT